MICKSKVFGILPPPHDLIIFDFSLFDLADMRPHIPSSTYNVIAFS